MRRMPSVQVMMIVVAVLAAGVAAQDQRPGPPRPDAQIAAMARLGYMVGTWSGDGSMDVGGKTVSFRGTEVVQSKLAGTALLVEGSFFAKAPGAESEVPVHTTLGIISFDPKTEKYRFTTWLATGTSGDRELRVIPDGWQWEIKSPRGVVRYVTKFTEAGEWFEIGERSSDGTTWQKFFEMKLHK
jgi:hypothetical protein